MDWTVFSWVKMEENLVHAIDLTDDYIPEFTFLVGKFYYDSFREYGKIQDLSYSFAYFLQYLQSDPQSIECLVYLGVICEMQNHFDLSLNYLSRSLQLLNKSK